MILLSFLTEKVNHLSTIDEAIFVLNLKHNSVSGLDTDYKKHDIL